MEKDLVLHLKGKYFEQIKQGVKHFEYRLDTSYWRKRLVDRAYRNVVFTLGYPKKGDSSRMLVYPYTGFEVQTITHEEWGNIPQQVFAIRVSVLGPYSESCHIGDNSDTKNPLL